MSLKVLLFKIVHAMGVVCSRVVAVNAWTVIISVMASSIVLTAPTNKTAVSQL